MLAGSPKLPHVTGILKVAGVVDDRWFTQQARDRGSAVHEACRLLDMGDLDLDTVDERIASYVSAYRSFLVKHKPAWLHIEERVEHPTLKYVGRLDRAGMIDGSVYPVVLDIKTGAPGKAVRLQTMGYALALREMQCVIYRRASLELKADGRYQLLTYDLDPAAWRRDREAFLAALTLIRWLGIEHYAYR